MEAKVKNATKASEAVGVAREQLIKAKVQMDNMHAKWKRNTSRLAGVVIFWEALHCKDCYKGMSSLERNATLCWAHYVGIALAFFLMLGPWLLRHPIARRIFRYNKETITALFFSEVLLFGYNTYTGRNSDIVVDMGITAPNPYKHYPFAGLVFLIAFLIDVYMVRQNAVSCKQFQTVNDLFRQMCEKESKAEALKSEVSKAMEKKTNATVAQSLPQ